MSVLSLDASVLSRLASASSSGSTSHTPSANYTEYETSVRVGLARCGTVFPVSIHIYIYI